MSQLYMVHLANILAFRSPVSGFYSIVSSMVVLARYKMQNLYISSSNISLIAAYILCQLIGYSNRPSYLIRYHIIASMDVADSVTVRLNGSLS